MATNGEWFEKNRDEYESIPWGKPIPIDAYICHEIGDYIGSTENSVTDGYYDSFPIQRTEAVAYAYDLYMRALPEGYRYKTKQYFEDLAERVISGIEEAWGVDWCPEGVTVPYKEA